MVINKLLPIVDSNKKTPSFYVAKNLSKNDIKDIIRLYEYILNPETKKFKVKKEEKEQFQN